MANCLNDIVKDLSEKHSSTIEDLYLVLEEIKGLAEAIECDDNVEEMNNSATEILYLIEKALDYVK
jgi:hypothetical protein